jgi:4-hydroxybenzoate polyprenyltransferase/phosphoglycolate phosphatase-like HAD superfamily hydrolase
MSLVSNARPLVVDLDGTLLRSDMLLESAFSLARHHPRRLLPALAWLLGGKAQLKAKLANVIALDVTTLPYNQQVLAFLAREKAAGRTLVLATASHQSHADAIANHLGLFDRVFASSVDSNLSAKEKQGALVRAYGEKGFDYVGNSRDDLVVWASSCNAYLADPELGVEGAAQKLGNMQAVISKPEHCWRAWARQLRLHQWAKNVLLFVPLLAAHRASDPQLLAAGAIAFVVFGLCASSVYLLNDLLDLQDDRQQPRKQSRPLASGTVPIKTAVLLLPALLLGAFALSAWLLPWRFTLTLAAYYALTLAYSLVLKRVMTVDVIALAMLYTVRMVAGTGAFGVSLTFWMLAFSMFLFLSLALVKRYAELREPQQQGKAIAAHGRGYYSSDLAMLSTLGAASGYLSVLVLALYIQDQHTVAQYRHPQLIWLACPLLLYWITRTWMVTHRGWMHDDPVVFALKDRNSLLTGTLFGAVFWLAL